VIVVDASAVIAFLLREGAGSFGTVHEADDIGRPRGQRVLQCCLEGNLSKENARRESARSVIKLFSTYLKKNVVLVPEAKHIDEAFNIALEKGVPIYDALYIALAIGERAPSLALDEKQRSAAITARQSGL